MNEMVRVIAKYSHGYQSTLITLYESLIPNYRVCRVHVGVSGSIERVLSSDPRFCVDCMIPCVAPFIKCRELSEEQMGTIKGGIDARLPV